MSGLKTIVRDLLPVKLQVPMKYHFGQFRKRLEPEMALLPALVKAGDRVIDIGGNRGTYAYRLEQLGATVEVFEPNPVCLKVLYPWAASKKSVSVHAVGLSATNGTAELMIPIDENGVEHDASASIEHDAQKGGRIETVPIRTLDSFGFRDAVLIKIDVEGHEQSVIDGAEETIASSSPALLIEIEQRHLDKPITQVFHRIEALGYKGFYLRGKRLQPLASFDLDRDQSLSAFEGETSDYINNFLYLHKDRLDAGEYDLDF